MRRIASLMATLAVAMTIVIAGCSTSPDKDVAKKDPNHKPKTVVINKGMNKKQEENLNKRLDKLEKKVDSQDENGSQENGSQENASQLAESSQPEQSQAPQAEDQAREAAETYYQAVEAQDWDYTPTTTWTRRLGAPTPGKSGSPRTRGEPTPAPPPLPPSPWVWTIRLRAPSQT